jgi:hypothetical protein
LALADADIRNVMRTAIELGIPSWAVGGGALRDVAWDFIFCNSSPTSHRDIDLVYFHPDVSEASEARIERAVADRCPGIPIEVRNQARVHLWYASKFGYEIAPIVDIEDAISRFPEICTSVAVAGASLSNLSVLAPCGLDDLFNGILRWNPRQVTRDYFRQRLARKNPSATWPNVRIVDD